MHASDKNETRRIMRFFIAILLLSIERIGRTAAGAGLLGSVPFYRGIVEDQRIADGNRDLHFVERNVLAVLYQKAADALDFEVCKRDVVGHLLGNPQVRLVMWMS